MLSTFSILPSPKVRNQLTVDHHLLMTSYPGVRNYRRGVYLIMFCSLVLSWISPAV